MPKIMPASRTVYFAPSVGRHFLTLKAACNKEAGAMVQAKYPSEETGGDWHWTQDPRLVRVRERLAIRLKTAFRSRAKAIKAGV